MRIFLGFFGMTRSLRHTIGSIRTQIFEPLAQSGIAAPRYGHFHLPDVIVNPRSDEFGIATDATEAALLALDQCRVDAQEVALIGDNLDVARRLPDRYDDGYVTTSNLCFQLRSLRCLWDMLAPVLTDDDWVAFLRPDLFYLDRLPLRQIVEVMSSRGVDLAVPAWQDWGGLNDRFAVASRRGAHAYATREAHIAAAAAASDGLHAESLLSFAAAAEGLRVAHLTTRAIRIRSNGQAAPRDLECFGLRSASTADAATGAGGTMMDWRRLSRIAGDLVSAGRPQGAVDALARAAAADPQNGNIKMLLGRYLLAAGRRDEALAVLSEAMRLGTEEEVLDIVAQAAFPGPPYHEHLLALHRWLRPRSYLEIGVFKGEALALAQPGTRATGIDPAPLPEAERSYRAPTIIHRTTSDAYFLDLAAAKRGPPPAAERPAIDPSEIDLAFIDGLHLFEQVLRDFINVEKHCHPGSVVVFHDTLPVADVATDRQRRTRFWCGDVWKIRPCLRKYRPDLSMLTIPTYPSGLTIIAGLDPASRVLDARFDDAVRDFAALPMTAVRANAPADVANDPAAVRRWLAASAAGLGRRPNDPRAAAPLP